MACEARIAFVTWIASPYQVELFDALHGQSALDVGVVYLAKSHPTRMWQTPVSSHKHVFVEDGLASRENAIRWVKAADLIVIGDYRHAFAQEMIGCCIAE